MNIGSINSTIGANADVDFDAMELGHYQNPYIREAFN